MRASQFFNGIFKNIRSVRSLKLFIVVLAFVAIAAFSASAQRRVPSPYQGEGDGVDGGIISGPRRLKRGLRKRRLKDMIALGFSIPCVVRDGYTIVEPTFIPRESFTCVARASLASTRTLKAHEADTHLARRF